MEDFNKIYQIMQRVNVNQKQLAEYLGVSEQKISDWKAGRIKSWVKYIDKIAECLGVTIGDCLGVEKEKPADELSELKSYVINKAEGLGLLELQKLAEHIDLIEAARQNKANPK